MEITKISVDDFPKICRICLLANNLLPINSSDVIKVFKQITNIEVKEDDKLPKNICKICVQLLEEIKLFIEQSRDNYTLLLLALNQAGEHRNTKRYVVDNFYNETHCLIKLEQNEDFKENFSASETETKNELFEEQFQCAKCDSKFSQKELLIIHIKELHYKNDDKNMLDPNVKKNTFDLGQQLLSKEKTCDVCGKCCNSNLALLKHKRLHSKKSQKENKNSKYNCSECDRILTSQSALDNHKKTHTGVRPYKCKYCSKDFAFSGSLTVHTRIHTGETPYICTICTKGFHSSSNLKKHKEKKHFDTECSNEVNKNDTSEDLEKVECKFCKKMFRKHGFGAHLRTHTNKRKQIICFFCSKSFKKMSHLERHIRIHTGERPFVCMICKKPFTQEGDLKRHWVIHSGQRDFQCQHCGKLFFSKSSLSTHITSHMSEKTISKDEVCKNKLDQPDQLLKDNPPIEHKYFLCTVCGKSFTTHSSLKVHIRLHTGDRPFVCSFCSKGYTNTSNLKRHVMRKHTLEKPHICMICHKGFHDSTNLKRHISRVHSVLEIKNKHIVSENNSSSNDDIIQENDGDNEGLN